MRIIVSSLRRSVLHLQFTCNVYSYITIVNCDSCCMWLFLWLLLQQVSLLSHRFRTVLMTLGAVNQVSTEIQVTRHCNVLLKVHAFSNLKRK
jgi:hypothetical protein